jgi:hypothetical protein
MFVKLNFLIRLNSGFVLALLVSCATNKPLDKPLGKSDLPPTAVAVPGKPGYVFSPYNNRVVDVVGIPAGTLVADPVLGWLFIVPE